MTEPIVTVLLSTHQGAVWLDDQLRSLVAQTEPRWQLVVVDDTSTDPTRAVLERWVASEPRITLLPADGQRLGPAARYLSLLGSVATPWWAFCDQDDVWFPEHLERLIEAAQQGSEPGAMLAVSADATVIAADGASVAPSAMRRRGRPDGGGGPVALTEVLLHNKAIGMTMLGTSALAEFAAGSVTPSRLERIAMHDWWVASLAAAVGELRYLDVPVAAYRQHAANVTGSPGWPRRVAAMLRRSPSRRAMWIVDRAARQASALLEVVREPPVAAVAMASSADGRWLLPRIVRLHQNQVRMPFRSQRVLLAVGATFAVRPRSIPTP